MSEGLRKNLLKYGICGGVCLALAVFYCAVRDFGQMKPVEMYRTLCDAFTVPGVLCLCVGGLLWVSNEGAFHGLGYCLDVTRKALIPGGRQKMEKYYDYVMRHKEKKIKGFGFLFLCGGVCMAIAIVFMILFYNVS